MNSQLKYKPFSLVVAVAKNGVIGNKGDLPWAKIPKEMKHFKEITMSKEPMAFSHSEYAQKFSFFQSGLKINN